MPRVIHFEIHAENPERLLVSVYPATHPPARECARKLVAVAIGGGMEMDWSEVRRLAERPEYRIITECKALLREVSNELKLKSPFDSDE